VVRTKLQNVAYQSKVPNALELFLPLRIVLAKRGQIQSYLMV
jgi:hypothetical protein